MAKLYFLPGARLKEHGWLLRCGWWLEGAFAALLFGLLRRMPLDRAGRLVGALLRAVGPHTGIHSKLLRNLAVMHPDEHVEALRERARRSFYWMGVSIAEMTHIADIVARQGELVEYEAHPSADAALREPARPAVLVTAHVGPWTLSNLIAGRYGFPLTVVYAPESNPRIRDRIHALRSTLPVTLIERDGSLRGLLRELGRGHRIGLATDVRLDGAPLVPLFGQPMETNTVPARLALRQGCPLIPIRTLRLPDGRFQIRAEAPIEADDPDADFETRVLQMTAKLSKEYERWIRDTPDQWMCLARRWPKAVELAALERARHMGEP